MVSRFDYVSIDQKYRSHYTTERHQKYALVFGHEVKGVSQKIVDLSDACIEIPQFGTKHSFNIAVSVGIVLWEFYNNLQ